jgi:capsular exopolysaccharide synthesis family protein
VELRDYWKAVRHRWALIAGCVVVGLALASTLALTTPTQYSSSARIFLSTSGKNAALQYKGSLLVSQQAGSYAELASGSKLASQVSAELGGKNTPKKLQQQITATIPAQGIIELKAIASTATNARDVAQAYAVALRDLIKSLQTANPQATGAGSTTTTKPAKNVAVIKAVIVDAAAVPTGPDTTSPLVTLLAGLVLGAALGVGLAVVLELLDNSVSDPTDIARATGASVLGTIPKDAVSASQPATESLSSHSAWAEGFRVLRTNVQYAEAEGPGQVLVVAGMRKGDGASTVAAHLAASMADVQRRVALLECDLRYPGLAERLGLEPGAGLTTVLSGKVGVEAALRTTANGLNVLPCGPLPPNPAELLASPGMSILLEKLRREFDVVILDAPPVLPVADAASLAAQADGALFVARQGKTSEDELSRATDRLDAVGAQLLGVVVNLAKLDRDTREYGANSGRPVEA